MFWVGAFIGGAVGVFWMAMVQINTSKEAIAMSKGERVLRSALIDPHYPYETMREIISMEPTTYKVLMVLPGEAHVLVEESEPDNAIKSRFAGFNDDEVYMLSRQAIHGSFEIVMGDKYTDTETKTHGALINELVGERKRRGV